MISKLTDIVLMWRGSDRKRRTAARLDDRTLRDIGLTRLGGDTCLSRPAANDGRCGGGIVLLRNSLPARGRHAPAAGASAQRRPQPCCAYARLRIRTAIINGTMAVSGAATAKATAAAARSKSGKNDLFIHALKRRSWERRICMKAKVKARICWKHWAGMTGPAA